MKSSDYLELKIDKFLKGYIFTANDFVSEVNSKEAVVKALNRMVATGKISKLSKGRFYKPEITVFGNLQPTQQQVVKDLLESDGKLIGYLTGYLIYNQLGLTTQVSNIIQIGRNDTRPSFKRERYTIAFVKQKNTITKENIPLLQILDAMKFIKKIPDSTIVNSCNRFLAILKELSLDDGSKLVKLSLKYPPVTRALLGALLDELGYSSLTTPLLKSLNPLTIYRLPSTDTVLIFASKWNIK